jgi:hypothetical protein
MAMMKVVRIPLKFIVETATQLAVVDKNGGYSFNFNTREDNLYKDDCIRLPSWQGLGDGLQQINTQLKATYTSISIPGTSRDNDKGVNFYYYINMCLPLTVNRETVSISRETREEKKEKKKAVEEKKKKEELR